MYRLTMLAASFALAGCMTDINSGSTASPASAAPAQAMQLSFDWGNIPRCNSGNPGTVANPIFTLSNVPAGTERVRFSLTDQNVPEYFHGGGTVAVSHDGQIAPGAFTYKSPCPPGGTHNYQWSAVAMGPNGVLATAKATKRYPE